MKNPIETLIQELSARGLWNETKTLKRNEHLKVAGSTDTNLYLITEGSVRIFVEDDEEDQTIRFGYEGNLIAALDSFISECPSELNIQALKKTKVKWMKKSTFMNFILESDRTLRLWLSILESFVLQQMERERDILTSPSVERYQRVLNRSPQLFQQVPNKYIAAYLRMTPETLSRIKKS